MTGSGDRPERVGVVELWRGRDGLWRYRHLDGTGVEEAVLDSNRSFGSEDDAADAARVAYPTATLKRLRAAPVLGVNEIDRTWRAVLLVVGALTAGLAFVLVKVVLAVRRRVKQVSRMMAIAGMVAGAFHDRPTT